jgi:hypothetical protein
MANPARIEEIERRLEQSRRLLKAANDPRTRERIGGLIDELEDREKEEKEK